MISKVDGLPKEVKPAKVAKAAVVGAGTMGGGIAMCFAEAGIDVTLIEMSKENLGETHRAPACARGGGGGGGGGATRANELLRQPDCAHALKPLLISLPRLFPTPTSFGCRPFPPFPIPTAAVLASRRMQSVACV